MVNFGEPNALKQEFPDVYDYYNRLEPTRVDAYLRLNMSVPFENHLQHHLEIGEPVRDWDEFDNALWTSLDQKAETEPQSTTTSDPSTGSTPV